MIFFIIVGEGLHDDVQLAGLGADGAQAHDVGREDAGLFHGCVQRRAVVQRVEELLKERLLFLAVRVFDQDFHALPRRDAGVEEDSKLLAQRRNLVGVQGLQLLTG